MKCRRRLVTLCLLIAASVARPASADESEEANPPLTDVADLWRRFTHKEVNQESNSSHPETRSFLLTPSLGSKPSTGFSLGFNGNTTFVLGDPRTTHVSSISGGFKFSQKKQSLGTARVAAFTSGDRWSIQADARLWWTSEDTFGLGADTPDSNREFIKYDRRRLFETVYRNITHDLYAGAGVNISSHANVRPDAAGLAGWDQSAYTVYNRKYGFTGTSQRSAGPAAGILFDSRDNVINPQRGVFASATYRTFLAGFLGGDASWHELFIDVRTYQKASRSGMQKLAFWLIGDFITAGTPPYFDLPSVGAYDRSARGYREGRYRGDQLVYGELEYRGTVTRSGLLGFVAFVNATTIANRDSGDTLFGQYAPAAGVGARVLLNKRSLTNLCIDYGWGKDGGRGLYLGLQEAF